MFYTSLLFSTLLICCSFTAAQSNDVFHTIQCQSKAMSANPLPHDIVLNATYATTVRYTNWNTNQTALITEKVFSDIFYAESKDRDQTQNYVVGKDSTLIYNNTSCMNTLNSAFSPDLYPVDPLIKSTVTKGSYKIGEIIDKIMKTQFYYQSNIDSAVIGGVDAVVWVGCNFNVSNSTTGIQIAVFFAGNQQGQLPYNKNFKNPVALSIHFSTFEESNNTYTLKTHSSVDITGLELTVEAEKEKYVLPPRGQFCENMTPITLPGTIPNRFGASIDFVNTKTKQIDNIEIMYDNVLKVTHYALDFENDLDIPFVSGINIPKGLSRASIYRDFNYGIQYITSKDGRICKDIKPLDASFGDCITVNGKVEMVTPENILLNISNAQFYKYGNIILEGIEVESFVAKRIQPDGGHFIVEVNFVPTDWTVEAVKGRQLHSIVHYHKDRDSKLLYETYIHFDSFQNYTALGPLWLKNNVFPCTTDSVDDNFFYVNLQNVSLKDIQNYGTENVECALAESLSEAVNVSVFRISYFMFKEAGNSAIACFLLGKNANVEPTKTAYLKKELTVAEFKDALNKTILSSGFVTKLITEDLKPAAIKINRLGVINTSDEPIPAPTFVGYSGGSMFILATFTFIFGAAIAVGTYIFYTKRRTISGMTYQVFE
uniref:Uncharacterized protein n=1 Tax=Panagrolaimus sp. PS1159 TaxID=55785 RepID=A0AC35FH25_9BILA